MMNKVLNKLIIIMTTTAIILSAVVGVFAIETHTQSTSRYILSHYQPKIGDSFKLTHSKFIYRNHNKKGGIKTRDELSETTKRYTVKGRKHARLKRGTIVTCLEVYKNKWIRIPSGWLRFRPEDMKSERN